MTAATYTSDLVLIDGFEVTTNVTAWNINGSGGASLGAGRDYAIEGTNAVDKQISGAGVEKAFAHDNGSWTIGADDHHYIWITLGTFGLAETRDNRGIAVIIGDSASAYIQYHVNGVDTLPQGGMIPYAVRFVTGSITNIRTQTGSPGSTPTWIGGSCHVTGTAKFANMGIDVARFGTGYDILNGTGADPEADFAGIATDDATTAEGVLLVAQGGFSLQGKLRIGSGATACEFLDLNTNIFFTDVLHALSDFTEILIENASSILTLTNVNFISLDSNVSGNLGRLEVLTSAAVLTLINVGFIGTADTVLGSGSTLTGCRWIGSSIITANGATLTNGSISAFEDQKIIDAQDETSYDNSPTTEGTFVGGTSFDVSDTITMSDGSVITVDAVSGNVVTEFTVSSTTATRSVTGVANTQVSTNDTGVDFTLTPEGDNLVDVSPLIWDTASDADPELDGMTITKGNAATHAIEFGTTSPLNITLNDWTVSGYNAANGNLDSTFHVLRTSGGETVTINVVGGSGNFSYKTEGAVVVIVEDPVSLTVNTVDAAGDPIGSAEVHVTTADTSGPLPFEDAVTITRSGSVATVAHTAHGMLNTNKVMIRGPLEDEYRGVQTITNVSANAYDYTVSGSPTTPSVGTRLVHEQDETFYNNSPTTEGVFVGGTGHANNDVLTLDKGVIIIVDLVAGGVVTEFTVDVTDSLDGTTDSDTLTQLATTGSGIDFTLSPDDDNLTVTSTAVIISGTSDSGGEIVDTRTYSGDQPVQGYSRKATAQPFLQEGVISGTISSTDGLTTNAVMISDE